MAATGLDIEPRLGPAIPAEPVEVRTSAPTPTPAELADLVRSFDAAARSLQSTHEQLRREVARLENELGETRAQLRRARELAALGEMAAGIAHEIRNPLGSMRLHAEVLIADLAESPEKQDVARKIARGVDGLNAVVSDVLVFSRDIRVRPEPVSARDLFEHAIETCDPLIRAHAVRVRIDNPGDDTTLVADHHLLHQAIVNVVRNACEAAGTHATNPGIRLSIARKSPLESDGTRRTMIALTIADNGPGIPADVIGRIFNPFFTTRSTGTGLGLPIAHRILDAHAGRVAVRSVDADPVWNAAGSGTIVELLLPLPSSVETGAHDKTPLGDAA